WCRLLTHCVRAAAARTFCTAGTSRAIKIATMAITTKSSISVNALQGAEHRWRNMVYPSMPELTSHHSLVERCDFAPLDGAERQPRGVRRASGEEMDTAIEEDEKHAAARMLAAKAARSITCCEAVVSDPVRLSVVVERDAD